MRARAQKAPNSARIRAVSSEAQTGGEPVSVMYTVQRPDRKLRPTEAETEKPQAKKIRLGQTAILLKHQSE